MSLCVCVHSTFDVDNTISRLEVELTSDAMEPYVIYNTIDYQDTSESEDMQPEKVFFFFFRLLFVIMSQSLFGFCLYIVLLFGFCSQTYKAGKSQIINNIKLIIIIINK